MGSIFEGGYKYPNMDIKIRNAIVRDKARKPYDGSGFFVRVHTNGGRYWRLNYYFADKEKTLAARRLPRIEVDLSPRASR